MDSPVQFREPAMDFVLPDSSDYPLEEAIDEINVLGFALTDMFRLCADDGSGKASAGNCRACSPKVEMLGQLVTTKDVRRVNRDYMDFGLHPRFGHTIC